jgi:hypothetical protein
MATAKDERKGRRRREQPALLVISFKRDSFNRDTAVFGVETFRAMLSGRSVPVRYGVWDVKHAAQRNSGFLL